ncbi:MAG TPA: DUF2249 domain-containing protein [Ktedonobacterales bacterium]|nr:DUF2249 domain-containing protein [Ktedonobacterales bacterium]
MSDSKMAHENSTQGEQHDMLDVRTIPPAQRHPMIFARFNALPVGGRFELVNDHDPKPLYYQLNFEYSGQLGWEYLEQGPQVWRVRISRQAAASQDPRRHIALHPVAKTAE